MAEPKISIKFEGKGAGALKKTIEDLHLANVRLTKGQAAFVKAQKEVAQASGKVKKITIEQKDAIRLNKIEFDKLSKTLDLSRQSLNKLGISQSVVTKASKGNAKALALVKRAYNMEKKAVLEALSVGKSKANQVIRTNKGLEKQSKAQEKVRLSTTKTSIALKKQTMVTRNLAGTFSVLRSKLLLFSFGMAMAIKPMLKLAELASDKNEILNKSTVVFGNNIGVVREWAVAMGASVGRAESTLLQMASSLQDLFVPMGYTREGATKLSTTLVALAIDVASFSNKVDADVLQDFQSAIVGNHKTVRKYGVVITEATLKQEAMNLGLVTTNRQLSENEKVTARISLIQKGSADAMGDAERTAHEYAQAMVRFKETWVEVGESIGRAIQPIIAFGMRMASDKKRIAAFAFSIGLVATAFGIYSIATMKARKETNKFSKALVRTGWGAAIVGIGLLAEGILTLVGAFEDEAEELDDVNDKMDANAEAAGMYAGENEKLKESIMKNVSALKDQIHVEELKAELMNSSWASDRANNEIILKGIAITKNREGGVWALTDAEILLLTILREKELISQQEANTNKIIQKQYEVAYGLRRDEIKLAIDLKGSKLDSLKLKMEEIEKEREAAEYANSNANFAKTTYKASVKYLSKVTDAKKGTLSLDDKIAKQEQELADLITTNMLKYEGNWKKDVELKEKSIAKDKKLKAQAEEAVEVYEANADIIEQTSNEIYFLGTEVDSLTGSFHDANQELINMDENVEKVAKAALTLGKIDQVGEAFQSTMGDMGISFFDTFEGMQTAYDEHIAISTEKGGEMAAAYTEMGMQMAAALVDQHMQHIEANMKAIKQAGKTKLDEEKKTRKWEKMSSRQKKEREKEITAETQVSLNKEFKAKKQAAVAGVIMDTSTAVMKAMGGSPFTVGMPWTAIAVAMGAAQLAMVLSQKPPQAALGGLIGGSPHSQGGTMIEAERGEFIMNKGAVDSVGIETMNKINMGGGGGAVNVSFSGNINSDDFIESEAIPKIKEAIRRGADIGAA